MAIALATSASAAPSSRSSTVPATPARGALAGLAKILDLFRVKASARALGLWQTAGDLGVDIQICVEVIGGVVGLDGLGEAEVERVVDDGPARHVLPVHERHRGASVAGAAGAAYAVEVRLLIFGALVVDHVRDVVDVDASRRDVGCDEHVNLSAAESAHSLLAGALAEIAVERSGSEAAILELIGEAGGGALGPGKDDRQPAALRLKNASEHLGLVHRVCTVNDLLDLLDGGRIVVVSLRANVRGLGHVPASHRDDGAGHRGREQHRVAVGRGGGEDRLDVLEEAEVEHFVGLVKHDCLGVREIQRALLRQINESARCADDDLGALRQLLDLRLVGLAAIDFDDSNVAVGRDVADIASDLLGELTGRNDDEALRLAGGAQLVPAVLVWADDLFDHRDTKAEGLACARLGLADDVGSLESHRQSESLDREGIGDVLRSERVNDRLRDAVIGEGLFFELELGCRGLNVSLRLVGFAHNGASGIHNSRLWLFVHSIHFRRGRGAPDWKAPEQPIVKIL